MSDEESYQITQLSIYYSATCVVVVALEVGIVRLLRRGRGKQPGDGVFVSHFWGHRIRAMVVCFMMTFMVLPTLIFITSLGFGAVLAGMEGWTFSDAFEYIICNLLGIGPMVTLTPDTTGGIIADVIISAWAMLLGTTFLGLSASLTLTLQWLRTLHPGLGGLIRGLCLDIPLMMLALAVITGAVMAYVESWSFVDGFLFMVGALCQIEDPLTQASPQSDYGNFFQALCYLVELLLAGAIIGVIGGHTAVTSFIDLLQGVDEPTPDETEPVSDLPEQSKKCGTC